jgi:hypothetical protein
MAAGGALALTGIIMAIAMTVVGNKRDRSVRSLEDDIFADDCRLMMPPSNTCEDKLDTLAARKKSVDAADKVAQVGGILLAAGLLTTAVGGAVYALGVKRRETPSNARLRVRPTLGGAVISGRF